MESLSNLVKGTIYVRLQPIENSKVSKYTSKDDAKAELLFKIEQWLNSEVSAQAFEKFGVGIRLHLPE